MRLEFYSFGFHRSHFGSRVARSANTIASRQSMMRHWVFVFSLTTPGIARHSTVRRAQNPARADAIIESQVLSCVEGETGEAIRAALAQMTDEELSGISPLMQYLLSLRHI